MQVESKSCAFLVKVLSEAFKRVGDAAMRADDITHSQMGVLACIQRCGDDACSFKDIQHFMHVSQPTTVGLIQRLEGKGFIETFACSTDQRVKLARLTEDGQAVLETAQVHFEKTVSEMERGFTEDELETFKGYLVRMIENLGGSVDADKLPSCKHTGG